jgi:pimeloyl-ACP methyl ester carboxylesterase
MSTTETLTAFEVAVPDRDLQDLRDRLARTRWPEAETVEDWSQGVPLSYLQELCAYWADGYDWRACEARLNAVEQFTTPIDGLDLHFLHVRSPEPGALPLLISHGWPGSVLEFLDVIGPLTDPVAHGGDAADAFHVVCPSLPGFGFSGKPTEPGWGIERTADAWAQLMSRLGYERYGVQGGDWGGITAAAFAQRHPGPLAGVHLNFAVADPQALLALGEPTELELEYLGGFQHYQDQEAGYSTQQATRPQTVSYAMTDSPAGQAAWIVEKFQTWTDCDGHPENAIARDRLLDAVSVYWLTASAASSARLYWESFKGALTDFAPVPAPVAYSVFPKEIFRLSERWMRTRFTDLRSYSVVERGGHFAAVEQPELFTDEVRAGFRDLR